MAGSSVALGGTVARESTFAVLLPKALSQEAGRKVELYNAARGWGFPPRFVVQNFNDVLSAEPDMILWILTPLDIEDSMFDGEDPVAPKSATMGISGFVKLVSAIGRKWLESRTKSVLTHYLYEIEGKHQYVESYLRRGDSDSGFLKTQFSAAWQDRLNRFDSYAANIEGQARAAGIPLAVVYIPNRAQAAMISMGEPPAGYNPYELDDDLRTIIVSHGGIYIDILPDYRNIPNPDDNYFPIDGHPDADGHAMISQMLAKELTGGAIPALRAVAQPEAGVKGPR